MENGKQPIAPCMYTKFGNGKDDYKPLKDGQKTGHEVNFGGLTKLEYFTAMAMQSYIHIYTNMDVRIARNSIETAKTTLKLLEENEIE
jgi:hypothetical protein